MHETGGNAVKVFVIPFFIIFMLTLLSTWRILVSPGIIIYHDWNIPPFKEQILYHFNNLFYLWNPSGAGLDLSSKLYNAHPWFLLFGPLAFLGLDGDIITKIWLFSFLFLSGFSFYYMCMSFKKSYLASILAAVFYMFTPWIFNRIVAGTLDPINYSLHPLAFLAFTKSVNSGDSKIRVKYALLTGLLISFPYIISTVLLFCSLILYSIISIAHSKSKKFKFVSCVKPLVIIFLTIIALNSFWFIPFFISGGSTGVLGVLPDVITRSRNAQLVNVIRLSGTVLEWYADAMTSFSALVWIITSFSLTIITWSAVVLRTRDEKVLFFSLLALITIFLGKGVNPPFGDFYEWLFFNVPHFEIFRDPNKIIFLTCLAYAYLFCESVDWLSINLPTWVAKKISTANKGKHHLFKHLMSLILVGLLGSTIAINSWPFLYGNFYGSGKVDSYKGLGGVDFPPEYRKIYDWLTEQQGEFRVLWLPMPPSRIQYTWAPFPQGDVMAGFSPKQNFGEGSSTESTRFSRFLHLTLNNAKTRFLGSLLGIANVKYVILREDSISWDWPWSPSSTQLEQVIADQNDLSLVKREGAITVFENEKNLGQLFVSNSNVLVSGGYFSLLSLSYLKEDFLDGKNLFFVDQISPQDVVRLSKEVDSVIIQDGNPLDLIFAILPDKYKINPSEYANQSLTNEWNRNWYYLDTIKEGAFTSSDAPKIPFPITEHGNYEFWIKLFFDLKGTILDIYVDDLKVGEVSTKSNNTGFSWVKFSNTYLSSSIHTISLRNVGSGESVITSIIVAPEAEIAKARDEAVALLKDKTVILLFELERLKTRTNNDWLISDDLGANASLGLSLKAEKFAKMESYISIPKEGDYEVQIRAFGNSQLTITIGDQDFLASLDKPTIDWYNLGKIHLEKQDYNMSVLNSFGGPVYVDQIIIKSSDLPTERSSIRSFSYEKIDPTKYVLRVNAERPFFVVLNEAYNTGWTAFVNGKVIEPLLAYSFLNSYFINETGELTITIEFVKQKYYEIGLLISSIASVAIVALCGLVLFATKLKISAWSKSILKSSKNRRTRSFF